MTNHIILVLCILILLSYLFDITAKYSKIPGVVFLIIMGIGLQFFVKTVGLEIPNLKVILPIIGTVGLIMIVMEASLDLKLEKRKKKLIASSVSSALILFIASTSILTLVLYGAFGFSMRDSVLNSIPVGIISSSVAIASTGLLNSDEREFVIYESSFSDIFGIILFDLIIYSSGSFGHALMSLTFNSIITVVISLFTTAVLAIFLHKVRYHFNYIIIVTAVVLVYTLAKLASLPALVLVLVFGLVMCNHRFLENTPVSKYVDFGKFRSDLDSFRMILTESTFIIRSFFFIMFGFYTKIEGLIDLQNIQFAVLITAGLFLLRGLYLKYIARIPLVPLLFFAPRGLITILLFLSVPVFSRIPLINEEVITLIILLSIFMLMFGNIISKKERIIAVNKPPSQPPGSIEP